MTVPNWAFRALALILVLTAASRAGAQPGARPKPPAIIVYPQANSSIPIPAAYFSRPAFDPGPFYNPALNNPYLNQTNFVAYNPFAPNPFFNPFVPTVTAAPPIAVQQPGQLLYKGPNLQVNPVSGLVYKPLSGIARTSDGSTFFYVPGTGLPTVTGGYATGSGLYFDPAHNTFLNPASGVISRPGTTNVFIPWRP